MNVERLQAGVRLRLIDGFLDCRVQKALDGRVERVQWDQNADLTERDGLRGSLEGVEHRPFTARQMQPRGPCFADGLEDFLDQLELVRGEWVVLGEVLAVRELPKCHATVCERELAVENVTALREHLVEFAQDVRPLCQQAGLDHFINVGAGE